MFDRATFKQIVALDIPANLGSASMLVGLRSVTRACDLATHQSGFGHGHSRKDQHWRPVNSKHGIWHEDLPAVLLIDQYRFDLPGCTCTSAPVRTKRTCVWSARPWFGLPAEIGRPIRRIPTGGGLPIPYRAGDGEADVERIFGAGKPLAGRSPRFKVGHDSKPSRGRYLVGNAGMLVAEVRSVKPMGGNHFTLVDAGMNDLVRPAIWRASPHQPDPEMMCRGLVETVVGGPLCESGDVFTQQADCVLEPVWLPAPSVGDLLVIHDAGAYGASMSKRNNLAADAGDFDRWR